MDISAFIQDLSGSMAMGQISSQVSIAVQKQALEQIETTGAGLQKIMESSVTPNLGQNIDVKV